MDLVEAQKIADIVNTQGRLENSKEIIVVETCEKCSTTFFSQVQDRALRKRLDVKTLCQKCKKEADNKRKNKKDT